MKRLNVNLKDRKTLTLGLCLILVCVFTLTVAYSALSAVLTIQGNARVSAADWDIYLSNPRVTNGSATTNVPVVNGVTATFNTTLNMPGDYYEFTVDVVNDGSIDAMIENVVKTPDLTVEQAKFLKYEVSYQNGEAITTKQLLAKDTTMPIKVRIEYRKDLVASDLPTGQVVLDLSLTLEYVQSDGTGSSVKDNGVQVVSANGDINEIGTIVTIGSEQFYTIGTEGDNVKLLSMYNLYVGGVYNGYWVEYGDEATGMQDKNMLGNAALDLPFNGTTPFSDYYYHGEDYDTYVGSRAEYYVNNYKTLLSGNFSINVIDARLITIDELTNYETFNCSITDYCSDKYSWIYSSSYWVGNGTPNGYSYPYFIQGDGLFGNTEYSEDYAFGIRPVIVISKDYF